MAYKVAKLRALNPIPARSWITSLFYAGRIWTKRQREREEDVLECRICPGWWVEFRPALFASAVSSATDNFSSEPHNAMQVFQTRSRTILMERKSNALKCFVKDNHSGVWFLDEDFTFHRVIFQQSLQLSLRSILLFFPNTLMMELDTLTKISFILTDREGKK